LVQHPQEEVVAGADLRERLQTKKKELTMQQQSLWIFSKTKRLLINLSVKKWVML
jgi:hypothetical protein